MVHGNSSRLSFGLPGVKAKRHHGLVPFAGNASQVSASKIAVCGEALPRVGLRQPCQDGASGDGQRELSGSVVLLHPALRHPFLAGREASQVRLGPAWVRARCSRLLDTTIAPRRLHVPVRLGQSLVCQDGQKTWHATWPATVGTKVRLRCWRFGPRGVGASLELCLGYLVQLLEVGVLKPLPVGKAHHLRHQGPLHGIFAAPADRAVRRRQLGKNA